MAVKNNATKPDAKAIVAKNANRGFRLAKISTTIVMHVIAAAKATKAVTTGATIHDTRT
jgi:hypothetical protein